MLEDKIENSNDDQSVSSEKQIFFESKNKKYVLLISIIIFILIISALAYLIITENSNKEQGTYSSGVCSGELLDNSVAILVPLDLSKSLELDEHTQKIISFDEYDKDPNCLYVVMQNYVFKGDLENAVSTFAQFESIYGDGSLYASDKFENDIETLRSSVEVYKEQLELIKSGSGTQTFGEPANRNVRNPYEQ